jgi:nucleotide-binding universal stress UspA family protein
LSQRPDREKLHHERPPAAPVGSEDAMFKQIVVGTDGSSGANMAVDAAIELARLTGATLHVVSARKTVSPYALAASPEAGIATVNIDESNAATLAEGQRLCDQVVERAAEAGVRGEPHCVDGDAADALMRVAEDTGADLLVVGNRGMSGARRFVLGSVPNKVSHHCPTNLLIVDTHEARA